MAESFPAPIPFSGKPRTSEGATIDWVRLHLAPPDPAAPFVPPRWIHSAASANGDPSIQFLPARQPTPVLLSAEELSLYNEQGFLLRAGGGIPVLTPGEVDVHRRVWQEIFDAHCDGDPQGVNGFFKRYAGAYDLVSHPVVVQLAQDILGPRCCCWGAHCESSFLLTSCSVCPPASGPPRASVPHYACCCLLLTLAWVSIVSCHDWVWVQTCANHRVTTQPRLWVFRKTGALLTIRMGLAGRFARWQALRYG